MGQERHPKPDFFTNGVMQGMMMVWGICRVSSNCSIVAEAVGVVVVAQTEFAGFSTGVLCLLDLCLGDFADRAVR